MTASRIGACLLGAAGFVQACLVALGAAGQPVGIGGPNVHQELVLLGLVLVALGAAILSLRPAAPLRDRPMRAGLGLLAVGAVGVALAIVRGLDPGLHAGEDLAWLVGLVGGALLLGAGFVVVLVLLLAGTTTGRRIGIVTIAAGCATAVLTGLFGLGGGGAFLGAAGALAASLLGLAWWTWTASPGSPSGPRLSA